MLSSVFNLRNLLGLIAIGFVTASIFFSDQLAKKIARDEKRKVEQYVEAVNDLNNIANTDTKLAAKIIRENSIEIPLMVTNENDSILSHNIDTTGKLTGLELRRRLEKLKSVNAPIVWQNPLNAREKNFTYFGESELQIQIRYFPIVQLIVAVLFILVILIAVSTKYKSTQNQVWAGMAKETAHQLGTPISSLQGWLEILRENESCGSITSEMDKDVERLKLVSDRFGKIGSTPVLEETDLQPQIESMVTYIKNRAPGSVQFSVESSEEHITALINPPLFDWVIENLLKNALDAMDGKGQIDVRIQNETAEIHVDVRDSGKGISKKNIRNVFKPGFTTKKRGWGLGLSLSKRIIDMYHKGNLYVKDTEPGKGTTFRIVLKK